MAIVSGQVDFSFVVQSHSIYSRNLGVPVTSAFEYIVLDEINIAGISNLSITVKNNSNIGNITAISVYCTPNKVDWVLTDANILSGLVSPNSTAHKDFVLSSRFLRLTVKSDATINIDLHLQGNTD